MPPIRRTSRPAPTAPVPGQAGRRGVTPDQESVAPESSFEASTLAPTKMLELLGPERFAPVPTVNEPTGKVVWCNFELARQLGFQVPASNRMTPELHEELIGALAFRVLKEGEDPAGRPTETFFADRYGGDSMAYHLGSGRAAFLPYGNLSSKGIGVTPLAQPVPRTEIALCADRDPD